MNDPTALFSKDHTGCTFSLRSETTDVCTKHFGTRDAQVAQMTLLNMLADFCFIASPTNRPSKDLIENKCKSSILLLSVKAMLTSWYKSPQTPWTHGYKATLLLSIFHALPGCLHCADIFFIFMTQLRQIPGLLDCWI